MPSMLEKTAALAWPGLFTGLPIGILCTFWSGPAPANLLRNPGFEETPCETPCSQGQGVVPSSWIILYVSPDTYSVDGSYGLDPGGFGNFPGATAREGIRWVAGGSAYPEIIGQELGVPLAPGQEYVLGGYLREAIRIDLANPGTYRWSCGTFPIT